jgi:uncharacterized protein
MPHPFTVDPITVLCNMSFLILDATALVMIWRSPTSVRWLMAGMAAGLGGLAVALIASQGDGFPLLQFLAFLIFVHAPMLLGGSAAILWGPSRRTAVLSALLAIAVAGVGVDAFVIEPYRLELTTFAITSPKVREHTRVIVIADFQTDHIGDYERRAMRMAMDQQPDLVLLAGDYLHQVPMDPQLVRDFQQLLREVDLSAPLGAYAVRGDVEHADWEELFRGTGVKTTAVSQTEQVGWLQLTGLSERDSHEPGPLRSGFEIPERQAFHIVLGHAPDFALGNPPADLLVAGHTHGGQVQLPLVGPLMTLSHVPRAWAAGGLTRLGDNRFLAVSRGIGMERSWAPRLRFLCPPQILVIDLEPDRG